MKLILVRMVRNCSDTGLFGLATVINLAPFSMVSLVPCCFLKSDIISPSHYTRRLVRRSRLLLLILKEDDKWK